jgi:hypothetical protein
LTPSAQPEACTISPTSLYSELGRRDLAVAKRYISERNYRPTAANIRRCRQELMTHVAGGAAVTRFRDFFNISECRDLLFHVQEHRFTIAQIGKFLFDNALAFVKFYVSDQIRHHYRSRFPSDATMTNLHLWHIFETENPYTFSGMYNFWIEKPKLPSPAGPEQHTASLASVSSCRSAWLEATD